MTWIRKLFSLCEHDFKLTETRKNSVKGVRYSEFRKKDYKYSEVKIVSIYFCNKCGKEIII